MSATRTAHVLPTPGECAVRELPLQFGPDDHLVGVLASPHVFPEGKAVIRPAVLFLNAGVIHRVGPHRLHVILARRLAARGVTSLRMDLSGIGDSRAVPGALSFQQSAVADARAAMDRVSADTGADRFVLFGLCSGADNALATAAADERVVGLVVLDPPAYVTRRARARGVAARLRALGGPRAVAAWASREVGRRVRARLAAKSPPAGTGEEEDEVITGGRTAPPLAVYRAQLGALVERGVAILAVFSGALGARYNHADQLFELFPELRGKIEPAYFPDANHTFTELRAQAELVSLVTTWLDRRR